MNGPRRVERFQGRGLERDAAGMWFGSSGQAGDGFRFRVVLGSSWTTLSRPPCARYHGRRGDSTWGADASPSS